MAEDHGSSVKDDKRYEGLRKKGMSKERAAKIANNSGSSRRGGEDSGGGGGGSRPLALPRSRLGTTSIAGFSAIESGAALPKPINLLVLAHGLEVDLACHSPLPILARL